MQRYWKENGVSTNLFLSGLSVMCTDARFSTREAEWRLTPGGRSRPRLVSGRGPAVRLGRIGRRPYPVGVSCLPRYDRFRCAEKDTSAHERWFCEADGGKTARLRTREQARLESRVRGGTVLHTRRSRWRSVHRQLAKAGSLLLEELGHYSTNYA